MKGAKGQEYQSTYTYYIKEAVAIRFFTSITGENKVALIDKFQ